jgi:NADPH-dependent 2,4-dienoyl-CoA reductase/sulfur reductase-like enzyme
VVVIGGGPAGMEFARLDSARGHRVTLLEREGRLGGTAMFSQLTTPASPPFVAWLQRELSIAGVAVRLGTTATLATVGALAPDLVVVATGARRGRPDVPGARGPNVYTCDDLRVLVAGEWESVGRRVVVVGGGLVGLKLAHFLAERGRTVTVLEEGSHVGLPMAMPRRWAAISAAVALGVQLQRKAKVVAIEAHRVTYSVGDEVCHVDADDVVIASGVVADDSFATALAEAGFDVRTVGDAAEVGYIEGAIHSAWTVAEEL